MVTVRPQAREQGKGRKGASIPRELVEKIAVRSPFGASPCHPRRPLAPQRHHLKLGPTIRLEEVGEDVYESVFETAPPAAERRLRKGQVI